jgi:predicted nucleotidyltransferase
VPESVIEWLGRDELPGEREPVIVRNDRDPLFGMSREGFESRLREAVRGRALEIYFFGSYATENFGPDSDIDLIIIARTDKAFVDRARDYEDLLDIVPSMDILVYTPEEFRDLTENPTPGFWQSATVSLRRLDIAAER